MQDGGRGGGGWVDCGGMDDFEDAWDIQVYHVSLFGGKRALKKLSGDIKEK